MWIVVWTGVRLPSDPPLEKQRFDTKVLYFFSLHNIVPVPLVMLWKRFGMALYLCLFGIGMYFAVKIEKYKKKYDIQTFKEIVAFNDGKSLDEIEKAREEGKRPYQKAFLSAGSAALVVIIALIMVTVMRLFS